MGAESHSHLLTTRATRGRCLSVLSLSPAHKGIRQCPGRHGSCSHSSTWDWKQQQLLQSGFQEIRDDGSICGKEIGCGTIKQE